VRLVRVAASTHTAVGAVGARAVDAAVREVGPSRSLDMFRLVLGLGLLSLASSSLAQTPVVEDLPSHGPSHGSSHDPSPLALQGPVEPSQAVPQLAPLPEPPTPPLSEPTERRTDSAGGWRAFGGQTFFLLGAPLTVAVAALGGDGDAAGGAALGTAILAGGGAFLFGSLAKRKDWNPRLGDALAGVYPGLLVGSFVGGLVAENADRRLERGLGFGALGGALISSLLFARLARSLDGTFSRPGRGGRYAGIFWAYTIGLALLSIPVAIATERPEVITVATSLGGLAGLAHVAVAPRLRF